MSFIYKFIRNFNNLGTKFTLDFRLHGRIEKSQDGRIDSLIIVEAPDVENGGQKQLEFAFQLVNTDRRRYAALDILGFKYRIHMDAMYQSASPQGTDIKFLK